MYVDLIYDGTETETPLTASDTYDLVAIFSVPVILPHEIDTPSPSTNLSLDALYTNLFDNEKPFTPKQMLPFQLTPKPALLRYIASSLMVKPLNLFLSITDDTPI